MTDTCTGYSRDQLVQAANTMLAGSHGGAKPSWQRHAKFSMHRQPMAMEILPLQPSRDEALYAAQSGTRVPEAFLFLANLITFYSWCSQV